MRNGILRTSIALLTVAALSACGGGGGILSLGGSDSTVVSDDPVLAAAERNARTNQDERRESIWDIFEGGADPNTTIEVNKYLWIAAQDVLDFLPIEAVDPFTGIIVYGYGTPPGGGRAYRATVYVQDPALEARSIKVALSSRAGAASRATTRAIEDAILTRARQLRIEDSNL
jgi:hypothetical protein